MENNPIILQPNSHLGMLSAEFDDEYLFDCFQQSESYQKLSEVTSPKMLLIGRTGAGKSAIVRYIEKNNEHVKEIDLQSISLDYIANSDIIRFLVSIDVNLDLIFQALWKHVLCIELIRLVFNVRNAKQSQTVFSNLWARAIGDSRKERALEYLKNWENSFWVDMDVNIKTLTEQFEKRISAEAEVEIGRFKGNAGYARTLKQEKKAELQARLRKVANSDQLVDLDKVLNILKEECENTGKKFYILFDRLDEKWVDESLKHSLISSLIECIKKFQKIQNLKIVVSLRVDLLMSTIKNHQAVGFQPDKFGDILQVIKWDKNTLKEFVDARINTLFERQYSRKTTISFYDIFCEKIGQIKTFDYILNKTLMRPRELLDFINKCLEASAGQNQVNPTILRQAEVSYSQDRLNAVANEWREYYPTIDVVINCLKGIRKNQSIDDFLERSRLDNIIEAIADIEEFTGSIVQKSITRYLKLDTTINEKKLVAKHIIEMLYNVGIVGVKSQQNLSMKWSHNDLHPLATTDIGDDFRFQINETFDIALNVNSTR